MSGGSKRAKVLWPEKRNMRMIPNLLGRTIAVLAALNIALNLAEPASAEVAVPAPIVGAGLPGLAVLGGVYGAMWLTRKLRNRRGTD